MASLANIQGAKHRSIFVAGWRPFIGWVCGFGLAYQFIAHPIILWVVALTGFTGALPIFAFDGLMSLTMALLGMGALRSYEKAKGLTK